MAKLTKAQQRMLDLNNPREEKPTEISLHNSSEVGTIEGDVDIAERLVVEEDIKEPSTTWIDGVEYIAGIDYSEVDETPEDLKVYSIPAIAIEDLPDPETLPDIPEPVQATVVKPSTSLVEEYTTEELKVKIATFKARTVDQCLELVDDTSNYLDIKEFKDVVAIMDTVEKSIDPKRNESNIISVQVTVQNMIQGFADDC